MGLKMEVERLLNDGICDTCIGHGAWLFFTDGATF